jgi:hypothetical protein
VGLRTQNFGAVFITGRPRVGLCKTSPFDLLLTLCRFSCGMFLCV